MLKDKDAVCKTITVQEFVLNVLDMSERTEETKQPTQHKIRVNRKGDPHESQSSPKKKMLQ